MRYFIDGYNLLFRLKTSPKELKSARHHLLSDLREKSEALNLKFTIVFDALNQPEDVSKMSFGSLEVIFTAFQQTADEYILSFLERTRLRSEITVVTSDKTLIINCHHLKTKTLTVENFLKWISQKKEKKKTPPPLKPLIKQKISLPKEKRSPKEPLFEYYLKVFEEEGESFEEKERLRKPKQKKKEDELSLSEFERWLHLFEARLKEK